ncbi:MAG: hypothetical protein ACRDL1_07960 [Solirubrobacterales bacterium]
MRPTSQTPPGSGNSRERPGSETAAEEKRRQIVGAVSGAILVAALAVAVVVVAGSGGDSVSTATDGAFGTHYEGLEERRVEAGVPTMSDTSAGGAHIHPSLTVYADGEEVPIPVNIGIDPSQPPEMMAGLHTHDSSGVIHVENAAEPTLGQFFEIWGVSFSPDRLGPHEAGGDRTVRMWIDREPSRDFDNLLLEDGQEVVVAYGRPDEAPPDVER